MTIEDAAKIMQVITAAYESFYRGSSPEIAKSRLRLWYDVFRDDDAVEVGMAVKAYIISDTSGYPPDVGKIKDYIYRLHNPEELTEQEAWNLVYDAACNGAYHAQDEFKKLPPIIQKIIGSASYIRDVSRMSSDTLSVTASNFMRSYKARAAKEREYSKYPLDIKAFAEQIAQAKSFDRLTDKATPKAIPAQDTPTLESAKQEQIQAQLNNATQRAVLDLRQAKEKLKQLEQKESSRELTDWTEKKQKAREMLERYET